MDHSRPVCATIPPVAQTGRFFVVATLMTSAVLAYEGTLDRRGIEEAISIGYSRIESVRVRFHQPYRLAVGRAPVDYIDVITPFRRVEVEAETRARAGSRALSQSEALGLLAANPDQIDFFVEITLHPMNTYVGLPNYKVQLVPVGGGTAAAPTEPRETQLFPRYGARVEGLPLPTRAAPAVPRTSEPILGGTVVAAFDGRLLNRSGVYEVVVREEGKEIARARTDFRALR